MREVDVPLVDVNKCEAILRGTRLGPAFNLDKNSFMCAGGEIGKDACTVSFATFSTREFCQFSNTILYKLGMKTVHFSIE